MIFLTVEKRLHDEHHREQIWDQCCLLYTWITFYPNGQMLSSFPDNAVLIYITEKWYDLLEKAENVLHKLKNWSESR